MSDRMQKSLWVVPVGVFLTFNAFADEQSFIEDCRKSAGDAERIACLEAAIRELTGAPAIEPQPEIGARAAVDDEAPPSAASADSRSHDPAVDPGTSESESEPLQAAAAAEPPEPQTAGVVAAAPVNAGVNEVEESPAGAVDDIGQEQVEARTRTREEHLSGLQEARGLTVDRFEYVGYRKLQVRLENGQIWRQIKGDVQEIRVSVGRNPTVDISESPIGGYRLRLNEIRRTIRVQRIR